MLSLRCTILAFGLAVSLDASADGVDTTTVAGHTLFEYAGLGEAPPLRGRIWYPAKPGTGTHMERYDHAFKARAHDGAALQAGKRRPLVLLSHGDGGSSADLSWLAERLAVDGFIAVALSHWRNTWRDKDPAMSLQAWRRPRDLGAMLDALLADPAWSAHIDPHRIAVAGFSSGGYAALALVGALYSPLQMASYCAQATGGLDCRLTQGVAVERIDWSQAERSYRDSRIRAAWVMAPALGPGMVETSLQSVSVPVAVTAAADDDVLPIDRNAAHVARFIPGAQLRRLSAGGHMIFMPECTPLGKLLTYFHPHDVCGRRAGLERAPVHAALSKEASRFLRSSLAVPGPTSD